MEFYGSRQRSLVRLTAGWILSLACVQFPIDATADVLRSSDHGFSLRFEFLLGAPPEQAYQVLVGVSTWWDPAHTYSGDATNLKLSLQPGGCLCETWETGAVEHLRLVYLDEGKALRFRGGLGPLQAMPVSGAMAFTLVPEDTGTRLVFSYDVGGMVDGGLKGWADPVDAVWAGHLARYRRAVEAAGTSRSN